MTNEATAAGDDASDARGLGLLREQARALLRGYSLQLAHCSELMNESFSPAHTRKAGSGREEALFRLILRRQKVSRGQLRNYARNATKTRRDQSTPAADESVSIKYRS